MKEAIMFVTCIVVMVCLGAVLFMFFRKLARIEEERWGDKAAWGKTPWWMRFFGGKKKAGPGATEEDTG
jgi:hypothetical protein